LKLDGYRALVFKTAGTVHFRSRNDNDQVSRYRPWRHADETVIDEVVALDEEGRPKNVPFRRCD
jgi:ATP-dependent DNA ligase